MAFRSLLILQFYPERVETKDASHRCCFYLGYLGFCDIDPGHAPAPVQPDDMVIKVPRSLRRWCIPNRVIIADAVKAGDKVEIAIFGINGPISVVPPNFVFFRQASVEFYK